MYARWHMFVVVYLGFYVSFISFASPQRPCHQQSLSSSLLSLFLLPSPILHLLSPCQDRGGGRAFLPWVETPWVARSVSRGLQRGSRFSHLGLRLPGRWVLHVRGLRLELEAPEAVGFMI